MPKWVISQCLIEKIAYPYGGVLLCTSLGDKVIIATAPDRLQFGVIFRIEANGDEPLLHLTLSHGVKRILRVAEIYWNRQNGSDNCIPTPSLLEAARSPATIPSE